MSSNKVWSIILMTALSALVPVGTLAADIEPDVVRIPLAEAVRRALEGNLDIKISRLDPISSREAIEIADSAYDSRINASFSFNEQVEEPSSDFSAESQETRQGAVSWTDPNYLGGLLTASFDHGEAIQNFPPGEEDRFGLIPETFVSTFSIAYSQPLLRNYGVEINKTQLEQAKNNLRISEEQFRDRVLQILEDVEGAYWDLVGAQQQLRAAEDSLKLAEDFLEQTKIKVEVGTLPPIEITTAEAEVASREEDVIVSENAVKNAEDFLRAVMNVPEQSFEWDMKIEPTDVPRFSPVDVSLEAALEEALRRRSTITEAKLSLRNAELGERFQRNQTKPELNLEINYAVAGNSFENVFIDSVADQILFFDPLTGAFLYEQGDAAQTQQVDITIQETELGGRSDSVEEITDFDNTDWTVRLALTMPLGNRQARAEHARSRVAVDQAQLGLDQARQAIRVEVRSAVREVETAARRVASARANLELQRKKVRAEEKRYENGLSTAFQVLSFQNDLQLGETRAIRAVIDYNKALSHLARVKGTLLEERSVQIH